MIDFYSGLYHFIKMKQNKTTNVYFHKPSSTGSYSKPSLAWRFNQVTQSVGKDTSGHSVGSFVLSQILYGQSDPIRLSLLTFFALSGGRNVYVNHSGSTPCLSNEGERIVFHSPTPPTSMTRHRPSLV